MPENTQWEYLAMTLGSILRASRDEEIEMRLNEIGDQGWEVVSAYPIQRTFRMRIIAKRQVTAAVRRQRSLPGY